MRKRIGSARRRRVNSATGEGAVPRLLANDNSAIRSGLDLDWIAHSACLPKGAKALIRPRQALTSSAGRARRTGWSVSFERQAAADNDPLTGWTGGAEPLAHVELAFPSREAAERYCRRVGLRYEVRDAPPRRTHAVVKQGFEMRDAPVLCCWPTGPHALCCGAYPCLAGEDQRLAA
jgi:hypothetical protein